MTVPTRELGAPTFQQATLAYATMEVRRALRNRRFLLFGIGLPIFFYLLYTGISGAGTGSINGTPWKSYFMVSMAAYGAMGAALLGAAVIAQERASGWTRQLRVTPLPATAYLVAKLAISCLTIIPGLVLVVLVAAVVNHVELTPGMGLQIIGTMAIGVLPFAALAMLIGFVFDATSAQGATIVTYVTLAIVGGLWAPISSLPDGIATIGRMLPSYRLANLGWQAIAGRAPDPTDMVVLAIYAIGFGALAAWRFRHFEARGA
jgi:ABC-2 type transport system permease protein